MDKLLQDIVAKKTELDPLPPLVPGLRPHRAAATVSVRSNSRFRLCADSIFCLRFGEAVATRYQEIGTC
jgi:hypothetical protein